MTAGFVNRELVGRAIATRMERLAVEWAAIDDDPTYCDQLEFARSQLDELLNDLIAGEFDIDVLAPVAKLPRREVR